MLSAPSGRPNVSPPQDGGNVAEGFVLMAGPKALGTAAVPNAFGPAISTNPSATLPPSCGGDTFGLPEGADSIARSNIDKRRGTKGVARKERVAASHQAS